MAGLEPAVRLAAGLAAKRFLEVADGIVAVVHGDGSMGLANSTVVLEGASALVVDAMLLPDTAGDLQDEIRRRGARPELVLNTHHHLDHVGGNSAFASVPVAAHAVTAGIVRGMAGRMGELGRLMASFAGELWRLELRPPEPTALTTHLPRDASLLVFTPAHSPADLAIWFPGERVLLAGDVCFNRVVPLAVHGLLSVWVAALDRVIALEPEVIVPGHGPVASLDDVSALRAHLTSVLVAAAAVEAGTMDETEAMAAIDTAAVEGWVEPERTRVNFQRARHEVRGEIDPANLLSPPAPLSATTGRAPAPAGPP